MKSPRTLLCSLIFTGFSAGSCIAANITLIGDNTGGFGGQNWNQADDWSNNAAPSAGNDYFVGNSTGKILEVPTGGPHTFAGDSLTIHSTGTIRFRTSATVTINNFVLNGGTAGNLLTGRVTLSGNSLSVLTASTITATNTDGRDWTVNSVLAGSGLLTLNGANIGNEFRFAGINSGFSGGFNLTAGTLLGFTSNSLGTGNIVAGTGSGGGARLDIRYDWNNAAGSLLMNTDSTMALSNAHTFGSVSIGGTVLGAGFYDFNYLNTNFDAFFVDGGTGSITVVPEPQGWSLLLGAFGWFLLLRRARRTVCVI